MKLTLALPAILFLAACSSPPKPVPKKQAPPAYFKVNLATAGTISGKVTYQGPKPKPVKVDMSEDSACVEAHKTGRFDDAVVTSGGALANVFLYVKTGLEGKVFEPPSTPTVIDQRGCWFQPRIFGIQTGQPLQVTNSDPVTHNIHPLAHVNREWNHSQGQGDAPLARKFLKPEIMIRVKCNIHSWMRAYIGVVDHPYFAVAGDDGRFEIRDLPAGDYTLAAWHETLGEQETKITVAPSGKAEANFQFKGQ